MFHKSMCGPVVDSPLSIGLVHGSTPSATVFNFFLRRKSYFKEKIIKSVVDGMDLDLRHRDVTNML